MFVYENENSLNLTLTGNKPVETPDVVIKGYENGASLTVNGAEIVSVADAKEFEGKAKTFVYQKDNKLVVTFRGIAGMADPEVTIDETAANTYAVVVNGEAVTIVIDGDTVTATKDTTEVEEPVAPAKEEELTETPVDEDEPEEVVEE